MGFYIDLPSDGSVTLGLLALAALITVYFLVASACIRAHRRSTVRAIRGEREAMRAEFAEVRLVDDATLREQARQTAWCPCKVIPDHLVRDHDNEVHGTPLPAPANHHRAFPAEGDGWTGAPRDA